MTFNPIAAQNVVESSRLLDSNNANAIDLGSQTSVINDIFLESILKNNKFLNKKQKENINKLKRKKNFTTREFFLSLGYISYSSIDINGAYDSYKFDLNKNIFEKYNFKEKFDLVINNGTGEHIFDQYNLFLNFHNLTKINGLMLSILPFIDWINHGFYNFNPIFFADLAASNGYDIVKISFANRNGAELTIDKNDYEVLFEQIKPNTSATKFKRSLEYIKEKLGINILLVVILKKKIDRNFKTPLQGKYLQDINDEKTDYSHQAAGSANAANQVSDNVKRE